MGAGADDYVVTAFGDVNTLAQIIDGGADADTMTLTAIAGNATDLSSATVTNVETLVFAGATGAVTLGTNSNSFTSITGGDGSTQTVTLGAASASTLTIALGTNTDVVNFANGTNDITFNDAAVTITGGTGNDTVRFVTTAMTTVTVDNVETVISTTGGTDTATLASGDTTSFSNVETINGSSTADTITTTTAASIDGNAGADTITGATGLADTFVYNAATDSSGIQVDTITNFETTSDELTVTVDTFTAAGTFSDEYVGIASTLLAANSALAGKAGQSIYVTGDDQLVIDFNGSGDADSGDLVIDVNSATIAGADINYIVAGDATTIQTFEINTTSMKTITTFTDAEDFLSFDGMSAAANATATDHATGATISAGVDGETFVFASDADGGAGDTDLDIAANFADTALVAAYLELEITADDAHTYVAVINDTSNVGTAYMYAVNVDAVTTAADTIEAGDITLIGSVVSDAVIAADDIA